jgi:hypothetical protein
MKAYLLLTGGLFGLVGVAHLARLFVERDQASDISFLAINLGLFVLGVGVAVWAGLLLRALRSVAR